MPAYFAFGNMAIGRARAREHIGFPAGVRPWGRRWWHIPRWMVWHSRVALPPPSHQLDPGGAQWSDHSFITETDGPNALFVDTTALREQVIDDVILSAFGSAGSLLLAIVYLT